MGIVLFVAGPKGANFLKMFSGNDVDFIVSYPSVGVRQNSYEDIQSICKAKGYKFVSRDKLETTDYASATLILIIGWQWITREVDRRFVIFHDSLLPKLRGFNPTVTAMICGDTEIGVTAFSPIGGDASIVDSGPIFGQEKISIEYPITIRVAYERLGGAYGRLADRVIKAANLGMLSFSEQETDNATYSLWRGEDDYRINWQMNAKDISRFVDAVGWPYFGAKCLVEGREIRIDRVETCSDRLFANRAPGKIWSLASGVPEIVCGTGMLRIIQAREADESPVIFKSLRTRLT
jgi:methionyl-tRNA formyltransferase